MSNIVTRTAATFRAILRESIGAVRISDGTRSTARLVTDIVLYRVLRLGALPGEGSNRTIHLKSGQAVTYRLNRGDIQSIREVMIDQVYRLPFELHPRIVVDAGANIGVTSLYFHICFQPELLVAVEPLPANAEIARGNLCPLGAIVLEAAVAPVEGYGDFLARRDSNLGSLGEGGNSQVVELITMNQILQLIPSGRIDLLKLDIEGGEQALLTSGAGWLSSVGAMIVEFHPGSVDYPGLIRTLIDRGFRYIPAGSAWSGSMDCFVRD